MLQSKIYLKFALLCLLRKVWRALDQPVTNKDSRDSNHLLRRRDIQRGKHLAGEPRTSGAQKISCKRLRNILRQMDEIALIFGFSCTISALFGQHYDIWQVMTLGLERWELPYHFLERRAASYSWLVVGGFWFASSLPPSFRTMHSTVCSKTNQEKQYFIHKCQTSCWVTAEEAGAEKHRSAGLKSSWHTLWPIPSTPLVILETTNLCSRSVWRSAQRCQTKILVSLLV